MKTLSSVLFALSAGIPLSQAAIVATAVRTYDSGTNANSVDNSATALNAATFTSNVATAFDAGTGGVVTFDGLTGLNDGPWTISYGSGKTLSSTNTNGPRVLMDAVAAIKATPISGDGYLRLTGDLITTLDFTANPLSEFGFTLLARSTARSLDGITVTYTDGTTASVIGSTALGANTVTTTANYLDSPTSGPDIFFGFQAATGKAIRTISIDAGATDGGNLILDDFGFIVSPIPEPSSAAIALLGATGLLVRRRRA